MNKKEKKEGFCICGSEFKKDDYEKAENITNNSNKHINPECYFFKKWKQHECI